MLVRALVHHRGIVVLSALAAPRDDVLLRAPACLSDMQSCEPACTILGPASRHGRPGPLAVAVLRAFVSRTSVKIPAPACPRAIRRAFNGGEQRSARARDVVHDHQPRARGHAASFIAAEQRRARASRAPLLPRPSAPRPRGSRRRSSSARNVVPALATSSMTTSAVPASSQRRPSPPSSDVPARPARPYSPGVATCFAERQPFPCPCLKLPCATTSGVHVGMCFFCAAASEHRCLDGTAGAPPRDVVDE